MAGPARGLLVLLVVTVVVVVGIDALEPASGDRGSHSVTVVVGIVGSVALALLGGSILRHHAASWGRVEPLWTPSHRGERGRPLPAIAELEALVIAASTGGPRARDRLDRRLAALGCETLAEHLTVSDPTPQQVTDAVEHILTRAEDTITRAEGSHVP